MIEVVGRSRLHLGLFDLAGTTRRKYGGIGMTLAEPRTVVRASRSTAWSVFGRPGVDPDLVDGVATALERVRLRFPGVQGAEVSIEASAAAHVGLGSKTTTTLAALSAVNVECDLDLTRSDLVQLSGRGGTSGIGVHSFFDGGLVVDAGKRDERSGSFGPSSSSTDGRIATLLTRHRIPDDWRVSLLLPDGVRRAAESEREFFREHTPIDGEDARAAIAFGAFAAPAAAAEADLVQFGAAIRSLQRVGFKAREIEGQSPVVADVLARLETLGSVAVGMSSMGPLVFAIWGVGDEASLRSIRAIATETSSEVLETTSFANEGFVIS